MDLRRAIERNGAARGRGAREKKEERKRAMTCSVISVLCIRPRLIYREPRRGTGCAPGAHPGPSHASALPAYPIPLFLVPSPSGTHSFSLLSFHLLISARGKGLAVSFLLYLLLTFFFRFNSISCTSFFHVSSFI